MAKAIFKIVCFLMVFLTIAYLLFATAQNKQEEMTETTIEQTIPGETNPESETETIPWESQFI